MAPPPTPPDRYAFDRFELAADASLLLREGDAIPLAPKVLQTLLALVRRAGHVVTKDDLLREVWPDCIVEETGLTRNVSLLRQALGDVGQTLIVTVPRVGYRLTAVVGRVSGGGTPATTDEDTAFVGRREELRRLTAALDRARHGRGAMLALAGEPGIGKTTLVDHFLASIRGRCLVGTGRCSEMFGSAEPHLPVLDALEDLLSHEGATAVLRRRAPTWAWYMAVSEGEPSSTRSEQAPGRGAAPFEQASTPDRLMRELTHFLAELAQQAPLVLFLDDVHWADAATIDVVAHLAARVKSLRVLVVLTYRDRQWMQADHPFARLRDELRAKGGMEEVALPLLTQDDVTAYVSATRAGAPAMGELSRLVFRRSEGNPLFMSALLTYLDGPGAATPGGAPVDEVPDSLRGLIDRMLQRLAPALRRALEAAAVLGYEFDTAVLSRALGEDDAHVEESLVAVERTHGLVQRQGDRRLPSGAPSIVYRFRHALYQSALLGHFTPSRRAMWARRAAEALIGQHDGQSQAIAGQLGLLFEDARAYGTAAGYFASASKHAVHLLAFDDASTLADRGLRCLELARDLEPAEHMRLELALTFARLVPFSSSRGYGHSSVEALVERAAVLAATLNDEAARAQVLGGRVFVRLVRAECAAARDAARELAEIAQRTHDDVLLSTAHMQAQIACHHLGEFAAADVHAAEVERLARHLPPEGRFINVFDPVVASLSESSRNAWITGRLARAEALIEQAVALGAEIGNPESLAFAWLFHAWLHGYKGDWVGCIRSAEAGMAVATDAGAVQTLAWNRCVRGWARAHLGEVDDGQAELAAGMETSRVIMGEVAAPQFRAMMVEVLLIRGDVGEATRRVHAALATAADHDDGYFAAEVHRLAARCAIEGGSVMGGALHHLHRAIAIAREQGAALFDLRAALALSTLTGDESAVHGALQRIAEPQPWPDVVAARAFRRAFQRRTGRAPGDFRMESADRLDDRPN
jgi:DNA-binding winged helix-turn-helix (wHTH) protein